MEQSGEERIANPYKRTYHYDSNSHDSGIGDEFLLGRPRDLLHLGNDFIHEALKVKPLLRSCFLVCQLLRLLVQRMLLAELAILAELQPVRIVLLVLVGLVITALALRAGQRNRVAHPLLHPLLHKILCSMTALLFKTSLI